MVDNTKEQPRSITLAVLGSRGGAANLAAAPDGTRWAPLVGAQAEKDARR